MLVVLILQNLGFFVNHLSYSFLFFILMLLFTSTWPSKPNFISKSWRVVKRDHLRRHVLPDCISVCHWVYCIRLVFIYMSVYLRKSCVEELRSFQIKELWHMDSQRRVLIFGCRINAVFAYACSLVTWFELM